MNQSKSGQIDSVMHEDRLFAPSEQFVAQAQIKSLDEYQQIWDQAKADPIAFWDSFAKNELHWFEPYDEVLEWNEPYAKWFVGGKTNVVLQLPGRSSRYTIAKTKSAIIWEGEPGDQRT